MKEENEEMPTTGQGTWIRQKNFNFWNHFSFFAQNHDCTTNV